jgi:hypothetical protein
MPSYPYELSLPDDNGHFRFNTAEELSGFARDELAFWSFLNSLRNVIIADLINRVSFFNNQINGVLSAVNSPAFDPTNSFVQAFGSSGFPTSSSPRGALVAETRKRIGDRAAAGCIATLLNASLNANDSVQLQGFMIAHEYMRPAEGLSEETIEASVGSLLSKLRADQASVRQLTQNIAARDRRHETTRKRRFLQALHLSRSTRHKISDDMSATVSAFEEQRSTAIASFEDTRKAYVEHMALKAPVTYWQQQSKKHRGNALGAMIAGIAYAACISRLLDLYRRQGG